MLGIEYALKYQKHLKGLVISSMTASIPSFMAYAARLKAALPAETIAILDKYEAKGDFQNPEYEKVMMGEVYSRHICRLDPWPEPVARCFKHMNPARSRTGTAGTTCRRSRCLRSWWPATLTR